MSINNHSSCFVTLTLKGVAGGGGGRSWGGGKIQGGREDVSLVTVWPLVSLFTFSSIDRNKN